MARIIELEGVGQQHAAKLKAVGVGTTARLLKVAAHRQGRQDLSEQSGVSEGLLLEWVNLADLLRIKGVGPEYSDLLEEVGVDTVKELRNRRPETLYQAMVEINAKKRLVRRVPGRSEVDRWVSEAKSLKPVVTY